MVHIIWFKANADLNKEPYHMAGTAKVRTVGVRTVRPVRKFSRFLMFGLFAELGKILTILFGPESKSGQFERSFEITYRLW